MILWLFLTSEVWRYTLLEAGNDAENRSNATKKGLLQNSLFVVERKERKKASRKLKAARKCCII
jgi:hypothetical protein